MAMNVVLSECPICKLLLTPWGDDNNSDWVCDCCGFGKRSHIEFELLQKIIRFREAYFKWPFMESLKGSYVKKEDLE